MKKPPKQQIDVEEAKMVLDTIEPNGVAEISKKAKIPLSTVYSWYRVPRSLPCPKHLRALKNTFGIEYMKETK